MAHHRDVKIGVIGGSGLYQLDGLELIEEVYIETPWGSPSDKIKIARFHDQKIAFLSRHGSGHAIPPSAIPNQANIAALKSIGVEIILAFSAVGSLREEIAPEHFVLPSQAIDRTKGIRPFTFFEKGCVGHVQFADPFTEELANIVAQAAEKVLPADVTLHRNKTLVVMEGPAFSTRAESHMYRSWGCDIINMSTLPEAKLAREAEISYQVICTATDYDCWREVDGEDVSVEHVLKTLHKNTENAKKLLLAIVPLLRDGLKGTGRGSVTKGMNKYAVITAHDARCPERVAALNFILPGYY